MTGIKIEKMDIRIRVVGIAKRQRTVKVHNIDLYADLIYAEIDLDSYVNEALKKVDETMRTSEIIQLYVTPWTQIQYDGYSMKEVTFCNPKYRSIDL